ncbi:endolytic transglycosylase MltG [Microbacterium rhizophilus]|uniref:endolytic transglycosylase MltG n=1 Tax=Microbacterium rhizophilus TaxID=3138934 RepID=UPI0031F02859
MTDPSRDESAPLTRRQARESSRPASGPVLPADAARDVDGSDGDAAHTPIRAESAVPWDDAVFRDVGAGAPTAARTEPATLAETAALTAQEPAPSGPEAASLEDLFVPENTVDAKQRRGGGRGCLVTSIILLVILGGIVGGGFYLWNTYGPVIQEKLGWDGPNDYPAGEATGEAIITIEEGDGGEVISQTLYEAGVTLNSDSFYEHLIGRESIPTFYPGVYRLQKQMTSEAVVTALEDPATRLENSVALREGLTVEATLEAAAAGLDMPIEELEKAAEDPSAFGVDADSLEGWLFPANYTFDPETGAEDVIRAMVDRTRESLAEAGVPEGEEQRILTIASIIQREGGSADFGKVARVILNRLDPEISDTDGLLQMDSTAQFGYWMTHPDVPEQTTAFSTQEQLDDPNPWNTYVHAGLPAGPIANAGDEAIAAAMNPETGDWQYFVTVDFETGETLFAATYGEQQQNEAKLHAWCDAHPGHAGCGG